MSQATPRPRAPFPWFGGKSRAAPLIWQALGNPMNFVEPFAGSLAVLFNRPHLPRIETVNDRDAEIANVWRALAWAPEAVVPWCDWPVNEAEQHAIHAWLVASRAEHSARVMGDPDYYDAQRAGRWLYGLCCWIGGGWCSGNGGWQSVEGQLVHLGTGQGVHRKRVHLMTAGRGVHCPTLVSVGLLEWFQALQARLRHVRVCCGDWTRIMGPSVTTAHGLTGILLDPPYSAEEGRRASLYAEDDLQVAHAVRDWCLANGDNRLLRIVLCGYGDIHDELLAKGWTKTTWTAHGGMANQNREKANRNKYLETLWLNPHCLTIQQQMDMWDMPIFFDREAQAQNGVSYA